MKAWCSAALLMGTLLQAGMCAQPATGPSLALQWDAASAGPLLHLHGRTGTAYQLHGSSRIDEGWQPLLGFFLTDPELGWAPSDRDWGEARFYKLAEAAPLDVAPLASNFRLIDLTGKSRELFYHTDRKGVVIIAAGDRLENLAPLVVDLNTLHAATATNQIEVWVMLSDSSTPRRDLLARSETLGLKPPVLVDRDLLVRYMLGLDHATEATLVRVPNFVTVYRGAIREGDHTYLLDAMRALEVGGRPELWQTELSRLPLPVIADGGMTYSGQVGPILRTYCARCHQRNGSAPFAMTSFSEVQSRAPAIRHQVISGNMPPWQADPEYGHFTDSLALSRLAKQQLIAWLDAGAPRGNGSDPLEDSPPPALSRDLTAELGPPDGVITLPAQSIQATGIEPYRIFQVRAPNASNVWLRAVALTPSNPAVVHHYTVYQPLPVEWVGDINLGLAFYVPGRTAQPYADGTGMYLGAFAPLLFELHYTPNGARAVDEPTLSLWYHRQTPAKRFLTYTIVNSDFKIPPGAAEYPVSAQHQFDHEVTLHSLAPHMHLRGRSMLFELVYPDGAREILLSVPHYHFHWQLRYQLAEPKTLPAGSIIEVRGTFDNSPQNLSNPDPSATVGWGQQSWDEMFMGVLEISQ